MDYSDTSAPDRGLTAFLETLPVGRSLTVADPELPAAGLNTGDLVLGIGIGSAGGTASSAAELVRAAGAAQVAVVLLRRTVGASSSETTLTALAARCDVPLFWLPAGSGWNELHRLLLARLEPPVIRADDELADLAQTIATLTGGLVTIEDTSARVLAYSRSSDEADELRRLSILGRSGPAPYLALLREWGVYDRLAASEEVVEVAEHAESGVRRRLAVGVFAGDRQLGTIWVQRGSAEFAPHAQQALLGAARLTALQLVGRHARPATRPGGSGLAALLAGDSTQLPAALGRSARTSCAVAVFELGEVTDSDPAGRKLRLDELATIVTVHAVAFRRNAVTEQLEGRIYLLLPNLDSPDSATAMLTRTVAAARQHLDRYARAAIGTLVTDAALAVHSRRSADLALGVDSTEAVLHFDAARPRLIATVVENALCQQDALIDPRIQRLIESGPEDARTLLGYLDTGSDSVRVAAELGVHPTTVRYRLRKAVQALGCDLADPDDRLSVQLQLRCGLRARASAG